LNGAISHDTNLLLAENQVYGLSQVSCLAAAGIASRFDCLQYEA